MGKMRLSFIDSGCYTEVSFKADLTTLHFHKILVVHLNERTTDEKYT